MSEENTVENTEITHSPERNQELDPLSQSGQNSTRHLGDNDLATMSPQRLRQLQKELADLEVRIFAKKREFEEKLARKRSRERRRGTDR